MYTFTSIYLIVAEIWKEFQILKQTSRMKTTEIVRETYLFEI